MPDSQKYTFHVSGMHCQACVFLTESELQSTTGVTEAKSDLSSCTVAVAGNFGDKSAAVVAEELTKVLAPHGYSLSVDKPVKPINWQEFFIAAPVALVFIAGFLWLQKIGLVNLIGAGDISYSTILIIGVVASLSTCMAVVGGLVLSMSATFAKQGDAVKPQLLFHAGRLAAFFILGGAIGVIGSAFTLNVVGSFILSLIIGVVMLVLGINLLDIFHWTKKLQPSMPKIFARHALQKTQTTKFNHRLMPVLVGTATFFLPCGFTQSMQIYTLSTGGFLAGGLTMLVFALGTLPVLALLSFSSFNISRSAYAGIFFKTAGLVVIFFAGLNLISSLAAVGLIQPLFNV